MGPDPSASEPVHRYLFSLGQVEENRARSGSEIPSYLFTEGGKAYHLAAVGDIDAAMKHYSAASKGPFNGAQWLASALAQEQERTKVFPEGRIEVIFLRAWVLLQRGKRSDAMPLFRTVAASDRVMREVAISLHIIGNDNERGRRASAEEELLRSIAIRKELGDPSGIGKTQHSLANFLSKNSDRFKEAEAAYIQSIGIFDGLGDGYGAAQVRHSFGNLLSKNAERHADAEQEYDLSIRLRKEVHDPFGLAQTLHSLANLLSKQKDRLAEAEAAYLESIDVDEELGNELGVAKTQHGLGSLLVQQDRLEEAEPLFDESIRIGEKYGNDRHLAQVLRSYGLAVALRDPEKALRLLRRSLVIDQRRGNERFVKVLKDDIRKVAELGSHRRGASGNGEGLA